MNTPTISMRGRRGGVIAVFAVIILLASAGTAYAQFGAIHSKITSIWCGILSGFSAPCDYETGGPLDAQHTVALSPSYGTAVASCEFVGAWGNCTASCPSGYSRTDCSAAAAINSIGLAVSPAENGCTCAVQNSGICLWGSCPKATCYAYCLKVPTQSGSRPANVSESDGGGPNAPTLASIGQCRTGTPHSITMQSTDPDNDQIRYGVDWDNDGSIDAFVPSSGYVSSGTVQTATMTHTTSSINTVKVLAEDSSGHSSDWASISFSCTGSAQQSTSQCSDNADNDGDGLIDSLDPGCSATAGLSEFAQGQASQSPPASLAATLDLRVIPSLVRSGNTTRVNWSAQNVVSCTVTGQNGDAWSGIQSPLGGRTSTPITAETIYTLTCLDLNGGTNTKQATVRIIPTFQEQ